MAASNALGQSSTSRWIQRLFHVSLVIVLIAVIGVRVYTFFSRSASDVRDGRRLSGQDWRLVGNQAFKREDWDAAITAYSALTDREPGNLQAWIRLAYALQAAEHWDRALSAHLRVSQFERASSWALYNIACIYARKGETRAALDYLREAVETGYRSNQPIGEDTDLASIKSDPEFSELEELAKPIRLRSVFRRYDFLEGSWRMIDDRGLRIGHFDARPTADRYGLLGELADDGRSVRYTILAYYDPSGQQWKQTWIDSYGGVGKLAELQQTDGGERFTFEGLTTTADGQEEMLRAEYDIVEGGLVHFILSRSRDSGTTWEEVLDVTLVPDSDGATGTK